MSFGCFAGVGTRVLTAVPVTLLPEREQCYHDSTHVPSLRQRLKEPPVRIANISGRLTLVSDEGGVDVETASAGRFGPDPQPVYEQWQAFREWAEQAQSRAAVPVDTVPDDNGALGAPVPRPAQVFAIGLNYRDHAAEASLDVPASPATFTKFPTCLTGPFAEIG